MPPADRESGFRAAVEGVVGDIDAAKKAYGVSNAARLVEGGLMIPTMNLDSVDTGTESFAAFTKVYVSADVEIHVAAIVKDDIANFTNRLADMKARAVAGDSFYAENNSKVNLYFTSDRRLYLWNKVASFSSYDSLDAVEPSIQIHSIYYAVYKPPSVLSLHPGIGAFIGELSGIVGDNHLHELIVWPEGAAITESMRRMPMTIPLDEITQRIRAYGGVYPVQLIRDFHHGLNFLPDKHFVILTGLSGSGKTSLAQRYAAAVHGLAGLLTEDPLFFNCSVRPEWTDPTGLTGYFDVLSNQYVVPPFLQAVFQANSLRMSPVFVCLDEMNLARVEYYFSDVLSAMETGLPIRLHSSTQLIRGDAGFYVPAKISWPKNLYIIGTINVDETTHQISNKVLDRAVVIDMSEIDLPTYLKALSADEMLAWSVSRTEGVLKKINAILLPEQQGFGYRVAREFVLYHASAAPNGDDAASSAVIDSQLSQKVLVKLRGTERQRSMLMALATVVASYPRASQLIARLLTELEEGSFQATR
jgi:hypothetical protein